MPKKDLPHLPDVAAQELLSELQRTRRDLAAAYARFDYTTEPELIDACICEIGAVEARYGYLLRRIKALGAAAAAAPLAEGGKRWV